MDTAGAGVVVGARVSGLVVGAGGAGVVVGARVSGLVVGTGGAGAGAWLSGFVDGGASAGSIFRPFNPRGGRPRV